MLRPYVASAAAGNAAHAADAPALRRLREAHYQLWPVLAQAAPTLRHIPVFGLHERSRARAAGRELLHPVAGGAVGEVLEVGLPFRRTRRLHRRAHEDAEVRHPLAPHGAPQVATQR